MKVRLIRPLKVRNPKYKPAVAESYRRRGKPYPVPKWTQGEIGQEIADPSAWKLVANGDAEPACEESLAACRQYFAKRGQTYEEGIGDAIQQRDRLDKGIHPKHFEAYDEGRMNGYDKRGRTTLDGELVELEEDQPEDQFVIVLDPGQGQDRAARSEPPAETL